jgi:hypothetical protein
MKLRTSIRSCRVDLNQVHTRAPDELTPAPAHPAAAGRRGESRGLTVVQQIAKSARNNYRRSGAYSRGVLAGAVLGGRRPRLADGNPDSCALQEEE